MRLAAFLAISILAGTFTPSMAAPQAQTGSNDSGVRIGSWIANDALLVLPDRSAGACPIGGAFGGTKLVSVGDTDYVVEVGGKQIKTNINMAWQLCPHPDLTNWLISFMKNVGARIDAQTPDCTQEGVIRISQNGAASSGFMKVQQASPFWSLPDWMESIDVKVSINPHDPTKLQFISMKVTPQAYERLLKPTITLPPPEKSSQ
ncbi:MAG: hypothetical protein K2X27_02555 [Candidatus Obscuribacterales bacterium]|nr:hypothetical protein [Candidatus Obscuribacterales bacterium]